MGPTWGPAGADRTQMGPMLAPWTLLYGMVLPYWGLCCDMWAIWDSSKYNINLWRHWITWKLTVLFNFMQQWGKVERYESVGLIMQYLCKDILSGFIYICRKRIDHLLTWFQGTSGRIYKYVNSWQMEICKSITVFKNTNIEMCYFRHLNINFHVFLISRFFASESVFLSFNGYT